MSFDVAVWEGERPVDDEDALEQYVALMDRLESDDSPPSPRIRDYVEALLARWPDLGEPGSDDSPWAAGPLLDEAAGPLLYVALVWSRAGDAPQVLADLAREHGLVCFDPQAEALL